MCTSAPKAPPPPPPVPEAPQAPQAPGQARGNVATSEDERRRRMAAGAGTGSTILTGPRGAQDQAGNVRQNTLLGG